MSKLSSKLLEIEEGIGRLRWHVLMGEDFSVVKEKLEFFRGKIDDILESEEPVSIIEHHGIHYSDLSIKSFIPDFKEIERLDRLRKGTLIDNKYRND